MSTNDFKVKLGVDIKTAIKMLKDKKIKPAHSMAYGKGQMHLYQQADLQPLIDSYMAKHAVKVPSVAVVSKGEDVPLRVVSLAIDRLTETLNERLDEMEARATEQNRIVLQALDRQHKLLSAFAQQLGVPA